MLRLSCSTLCFREQPIETALEEIQRAGFTTLELALLPGVCHPFDALNCGLTEREDFVALVRQSGLEVTTLTARPSELGADGGTRDLRAQPARAYFKVAALLGAGTVNIPSGAPEPDRSRFLSVLARQSAVFKQIAREAAELGLQLAVEAPHPQGICQTMADSAELLAAIDEPNVGSVFDDDYVREAGADPAVVSRAWATRILHVRLRHRTGTGRSVRHQGTGASRKGLLETLEDAGYAGTCAVELDGWPDALDERRQALHEALTHLNAPTRSSVAEHGHGRRFRV